MVPARKRSVRTLFLSDVHLGSRSCKPNHLLSLLDHVEAGRVFLVGDIIDLWKLRGRVYWPESHNEVVHRILELARGGTEVVFIPGNHDATFRRHLDLSVCGIRLERQARHELASGRELIVMHGDEFDPFIRPGGLRAWLADRAYAATMRLDRIWDWARRRLGMQDYWSLAAFLKARSDQAEQAISKFEQAARQFATRAGAAGVICGHIHRPALDRSDDNCIYANCGDWVESCSALVETELGELEIVRWRSTDRLPSSQQGSPPARVADLSRLALSESFMVG